MANEVIVGNTTGLIFLWLFLFGLLQIIKRNFARLIDRISLTHALSVLRHKSLSIEYRNSTTNDTYKQEDYDGNSCSST